MKKLLLFSSVSLIIIGGCKKKDDSIILSPDKGISEIVFRAADNDVLLQDVTASITGNIISADFPQLTPLNYLVPTISFKGKSITPAGKVPQNFENPVTYTVLAEDGSTEKFTISANRPAANLTKAIVAKWKIIKDSVTNDNYVYPGGGYITPGVYWGATVDFYDFIENGDLSVHENGSDFNTSYQLLADTTIYIPDLTVHGPTRIQTLNSKYLTLFWNNTSSNGNGGKYHRTLYLSK
ncbi:MAG: hypothetical protein ABIO55_14785 [Ginsengibacter sp.]